MTQNNHHIALAGASPDTGNQGVTALCHSTILGLMSQGLKSATIFDHGPGTHRWLTQGIAPDVKLQACSLRPSKRIWQSDSFYNARARQFMGLPSDPINILQKASALLDISGGDSFTDLYGPARFRQIIQPKLMALKAGTPLILLPQTYGPFKHRSSRRIARKIISQAHLVYARDADSMAALKALMGMDFDPVRYRLGVDMAFGLPLSRTIGPKDPNHIGINISGLLWHQAEDARSKFGLKVNYRKLIMDLVHALLKDPKITIRLVPHVFPDSGFECDKAASYDLHDRLTPQRQNRVHIDSNAKTPSALKASIAETAWFTGARMHATIAALSTGVPVANMAYSMKARGVFACCDMADSVMDLRHMTTDQALSALLRHFENRREFQARLEGGLPHAMRQWRLQLEHIARVIGFANPSQGKRCA